jgi:2,3-bisphosphoglycerate-dependent phosphoglycerate mutase
MRCGRCLGSAADAWPGRCLAELACDRGVIQGGRCGGVGVGKLYVVRHAEVTVDMTTPAAEWPLSDQGIASTRRLVLSRSWSDVRHIYHSPELKARRTAEVMSEMTGIRASAVDDLRELAAPQIAAPEAFVARVGRYLMGVPDRDFESWDHAMARIVRAMAAIVATAPGESAAVVSHGRILTVWFSHWFQRRLTAADWQSIRLPDLSVVDWETHTVESGFFADLAP